MSDIALNVSNLILKELPYRNDSGDYFSALRDYPWPVWLDSGGAEGNPHRGRYDILSAGPCQRLIADNSGIRLEARDELGCLRQQAKASDVWHLLKQAIPTSSSHVADSYGHELPFTGGALGYLGYDVGRLNEQFTDRITDDTGLPLLLMGIYRWAIIQDHARQRTTLVYPGNLGQAYDEPSIAALTERIEAIAEPSNEKENSFFISKLQSNTDKSLYLEKLASIKAYIRAGDCYQVNFAQRFQASYSGDLFQAYRHLRKALPSPFSCFFETEFGSLLSVSPERFIHSDGRNLLTQPIKGTIERGSTPAEDTRLAQQLLSSEKDQAENLMIVDLLRNDLSKVCTPGSVHTPKLFDLESYANVHHLVSTVTGTLLPDHHPADILAACFPGGSITGAPKIRAMEIIEELENSRRSAYCGSIGYIGFDGQMDTNIAIRTVAANDRELFVWGGGGIVSDSDPESEYQETLTKVGRILEALQELASA